MEEDNGDDALGFSSSNGSDHTGTDIDITDNSHYITSAPLLLNDNC